MNDLAAAVDRAGVPPACLPERLTLEVAASTLAQLQQGLAGTPAGDFVLDAGGLREFDSSAVAVLLELRRESQRQGRALRLVNGPARLRDLIALYGVAELLPV